MNSEPVYLIYDHECPFCRQYSQMVKIKQTVGSLLLVNAREPSKIMDEINAKGLNVDEGMVLKYKETLYFGADAIHLLTLMSTKSDIFNKLIFGIFHSANMSRLLYPILKACRLFALWITDAPLINDKQASNNQRENHE